MLDDEGGDALASGGLVGHRHDDHDVPTRPCVVNVFAPFSTQHVAGPDRGRAHAGGVAAGGRLGQAPGADVLAPRERHAGTSASAPRCRTAGCAPSRGRCARRPTARRRIDAGELLDADAVVDAPTWPAPPYASGTWMPSRPSSPRRGTSSVGKCCASSHSRTCGTDFGLRELAHAAAQQLLILGQAEVHGAPRLYYHEAGGIMSTARAALLSALILVLFAAPAAADATIFLGANTTPESRKTQGFAIGAGLLLIGFEFEYAGHVRRSGVAGALAQDRQRATCCCRRRSPSSASSRTSRPAPAPIARRSTTAEHTGFGFNTGGGVKVSPDRSVAAARRLPGVQAGRRCAVLASAPPLHGSQPEVLAGCATWPDPAAGSASACSRLDWR